MQKKKKKICKMSTPFHICACIKKIMSIPCIPSPDFFPAAIDRKGLLFLNAHYSPALLGGGKENANWVAKRLVPLPLRNQSASLIMGRLAPHTPPWGSWWKYAPPTATSWYLASSHPSMLTSQLPYPSPCPSQVLNGGNFSLE